MESKQERQIRLRKESDKRYIKKNPWAGVLQAARQRCRNPKLPCYHSYGGRGIKCHLTMEEIKYLWERDATKLKRPSIHRIDNNKDYTIDNCKFMDLKEHFKIDKKYCNTKGVLQYSLNGKLIKKWISQQEASRKLCLNQSDISRCTLGQRNHCGGFVWKTPQTNFGGGE